MARLRGGKGAAGARDEGEQQAAQQRGPPAKPVGERAVQQLSGAETENEAAVSLAAADATALVGPDAVKLAHASDSGWINIGGEVVSTLPTSFILDYGTGTGVRAAGYQGPVAGKTGTTNNATDAWFVGYTPELVGTVWLGSS